MPRENIRVASEIDFLSYLGTKQHPHVITPQQARARTEQYIEHGIVGGAPVPWQDLHGKFSLRPKEVTIWAGYNSSGKSQLLGQVMSWLMRTEKCLVASLEMPFETTLFRMMRQCSACTMPSSMFRERWYDYATGKLWIYDQLQTVRPDVILGLIEYAAIELGIQHIFVDSLVKCGLDKGMRQQEEQTDFVDKLCWAAKRHDIHIHLVHHMRKPDLGISDAKIPTRWDIKGAGEITDLADNVVIIWRNKPKELKRSSGKEYDPKEADCLLCVDKQRHGEWEGRFRLYFQPESLQYTRRVGVSMPWPSPGELWSFPSKS